MISILVLVGLAVVWAIVIFPDVLRWISNNRRGDTIRTFNSQLSSLGRSNALRQDNVIDLRDRMVAPVAPGNTLRAPSRHVVPIGAAGSEPLPAPQPSATLRGPIAGDGLPGGNRNRGIDGPRPVSPWVRKRRQDVLVALGAACLLTLLATLAFGPFFLYLHLLADVLLIGYLLALQHVISGGHMFSKGKAPVGHGTRDTLAPAGGARAIDYSPVRPQVMEPRRIAN